MTKQRLRTIMGENIRAERLARNMSIDELGELLELTPGFVGLIERGQRGATPHTLYKLSEIFGISIDRVFAHAGHTSLSLAETTQRDVAEIKRNKIASLISDMAEKELEFIITAIKNLRELTRGAGAFEED